MKKTIGVIMMAVMSNPVIQEAAPNGGISATMAGACTPNNGKLAKPSAFTLYATGGVGGTNGKLQDAAGLVESIQGTLGATLFQVRELPDRAALASYGVADQLGSSALRRSLFMTAMEISEVIYKVSSAAQLNNPMKVYYGSEDGSVNIVTKSVSKDQNNSQFNPLIIPITGTWMLTGKTAIQVALIQDVTVDLTFNVKRLVPYSELV